jgi:hypothetical protein
MPKQNRGALTSPLHTKNNAFENQEVANMPFTI